MAKKKAKKRKKKESFCEICGRDGANYKDYKDRDTCWRCSLIKRCSEEDCGAEEDVRTDRNGKSLCEECLEEKQLAWDKDDQTFIPLYRKCKDCGDEAEWCKECQTYTCFSCNPSGTCQCS